MRAHSDEVLAEHLPDARPDKPDASHVQVSDLDEFLKAEFSRVD